MITEYEKIKAIEHIEDLASIISNNSEGILYYKIFVNFILKSSPSKDFKIVESNISNKNEIKKSLREILEYIVNVASQESTQKFYTTGELSKYVGVSITSINNWIKENRFVGVKRVNPHKQIRISENTLCRSSNGELIPVKEIINMWHKEHKKRITINKKQELKALHDEIKFFEAKYGGTYEKTLKLKKHLTESELRNKEEWEYLLKRINK